MMNRKVAALGLIAIVVIAGCRDSNNRDIAIEVDRQQEHYANAQPVPYFDYSIERDILIQLYQARNQRRQTTAVVTSQGTGDVIFTCPSIGDGIAADTQLTNPQAPYDPDYTDSAVVAQPEPNGIFSSTNTTGTYVLCIRPNGDVAPVYTEQEVTTFPFPVEVAADGTITDAGGESTITLNIPEGDAGRPQPSAAP